MDPYLQSNNPQSPRQFASPYLTQKSAGPDNKIKKPKSIFKKIFILIVIIALLAAGYKVYSKNVYWEIKKVFVNDALPVIDKEKSFSIIVLPDTQFYSEEYPDTFCLQTNWIKENIGRLNIAYMSHMGDITNHGGKTDQWNVAVKCLGTLDGVIPYGLVAGNHDTDKPHNKSSGFSNYNRYFPAKKFSDEKWYIDNYSDNRNSAILIEKLGVKMLFINLEIEPSDESIVWANNVIQKNPGIYTIVTTHKYLPDDSDKLDEDTQFSDPGPNNNGSQIWRKLVNMNCQIKMVWNGHYHKTDGENRLTSINSCGDKVEQILQDYQTRENGGNGLLRIYTFTPQEKKIEVSTYSPLLESYERDASSEFELDFAI